MTSAIAAWESLFRAQVRVLRVLNAEFPDDVLTFNEYDVMFTVSREPQRELRMRELTRNVLLSQSSLSRLVDRLVARGLLVKREDPRDGRGAVVAMTADGLTVFRKVAREHGRSITEHVSRALSHEELSQLEQICSKLQLAMPDVAPNSSRTPLHTQ